MSPIIVLLIIVLAVIMDYFWFDVDKKRWGWMKNWSKFKKIMFFSSFVVVSVIIYLGLSLEFL
ncbi:hypothetical protein [Bacillus benzoevorans]|uniref:Uncharacterized protein n=1 Tax=Bacillus benzoevorans TaxID=1456 RepID=A0A7X0HW18_9BACI|nr:hypothetical protein [Bacillus benzoevorans]MBB6447873.1 hypothetical protein [Bacillus benzoevorans]